MTKTKRVCITLKKDVLEQYQEKLKQHLTPLSTGINALIENELAREEI